MLATATWLLLLGTEVEGGVSVVESGQGTSILLIQLPLLVTWHIVPAPSIDDVICGGARREHRCMPMHHAMTSGKTITVAGVHFCIVICRGIETE